MTKENKRAQGNLFLLDGGKDRRRLKGILGEGKQSAVCLYFYWSGLSITFLVSVYDQYMSGFWLHHFQPIHHINYVKTNSD
jgi:hypothetical protein